MNVYERIFKLWSSICKMIVDGVRDPEKVADALQVIVDEVVVKNYLRRLEVVRLGATDSTETYETAKKVFEAGFDSDFENFGIIFSGIAPEMDVAVDELVKNGKFREFLGETLEELERRRMLGSQFVKFCRDIPGKLKQGGNASFFVLTKNDEPVAVDLSNVFVASVLVNGGGQLDSYVNPFDRGNTWYAECRHRILYPQR